MARKVIQLEQVGLPSDASYRFAYWLDIPAARQTFYANANAVSAVKDATVAELNAIKAGAILEEIVEFSRPVGTLIATIRQDAVQAYNARQLVINRDNSYNRYGSFYDGTGWTNVSIA